MLKGLRKRLALVFTVFTGAVLLAVLGVSFYSAAQQTIQANEVWFSTTADRVASTVMTNAWNGENTSINPGEYIVYVLQDGQPMDGLISAPAATDAVAALPSVSPDEAPVMFEQAKALAEERGTESWAVEGMYMAGVAAGTLAQQGLVGASITVNDETVPGQPADTDAAIPLEGSIAVSIAPVTATDAVFDMDYGGTRYRATYLNWVGPVQNQADSVYEMAILEDLSGQTDRLWLTALWYFLLFLAGVALLFLANWFLAKLILRPTEEGLRRQTEFVAAASHELRSPLAVIRSSLSAAEAASDDAQAAKYQTAASDEARRMSGLVDDLLLLAGGDAGSWQLTQAPVDLDTLLIDAAEVYRPMGKEKGVELLLDLPDEALPQVQGDAERLRQILTVLMDNALQYAPQNTAVTLAARAKKGRVQVSVADRGRGVPDDEKERVFQRFYRADKSRTDKAHFGLGLSVARELAELHGGRMAVKDTADGGATFVLSLPAA